MNFLKNMKISEKCRPQGIRLAYRTTIFIFFIFLRKFHKIPNFIQDQILATSFQFRFPRKFKIWFHSWHSISESNLKLIKYFQKHFARSQICKNAISHLHQNLRSWSKCLKIQKWPPPPKTSKNDPPVFLIKDWLTLPFLQ